MAVLALTDSSLPFSNAPALTKQCINSYFTVLPAGKVPLPQTLASSLLFTPSLFDKPLQFILHQFFAV